MITIHSKHIKTHKKICQNTSIYIFVSILSTQRPFKTPYINVHTISSIQQAIKKFIYKKYSAHAAITVRVRKNISKKYGNKKRFQFYGLLVS